MSIAMMVFLRMYEARKGSAIRGFAPVYQFLYEVVLDRKACGSTAGIDPQLIEDGSDMRVDRRQAHYQLFGDLGIGQPLCQ